MLNKQKIILYIAEYFSLELTEEMQKYVLAYKNQYGIKYEFVNGFSFELEEDLRYFFKKEYSLNLDFLEKDRVEKLDLTLENKLQKRENSIYGLASKTLFTIGYEGISIDEYINKLLDNHIKIVVDVRANAYSGKFGFTKEVFSSILQRVEIEYIHIPELGIESEKRRDAKVGVYKQNSMSLFNDESQNCLFEDYKKFLPTRKKYVQKLLDILEGKKAVAITCFEKNHRDCHRSVLAEFCGVDLVHL